MGTLDPLAPDEALVASMSRTITQDLGAGRLDEAQDMVALLQLAAPVHMTTFELAIAVAEARGETAKARAYAEVASWV